MLVCLFPPLVSLALSSSPSLVGRTFITGGEYSLCSGQINMFPEVGSEVSFPRPQPLCLFNKLMTMFILKAHSEGIPIYHKINQKILHKNECHHPEKLLLAFRCHPFRVCAHTQRHSTHTQRHTRTCLYRHTHRDTDIPTETHRHTQTHRRTHRDTLCTHLDIHRDTERRTRTRKTHRYTHLDTNTQASAALPSA